MGHQRDLAPAFVEPLHQLRRRGRGFVLEARAADHADGRALVGQYRHGGRRSGVSIPGNPCFGPQRQQRLVPVGIGFALPRPVVPDLQHRHQFGGIAQERGFERRRRCRRDPHHRAAQLLRQFAQRAAPRRQRIVGPGQRLPERQHDARLFAEEAFGQVRVGACQRALQQRGAVVAVDVVVIADGGILEPARIQFVANRKQRLRQAPRRGLVLRAKGAAQPLLPAHGLLHRQQPRRMAAHRRAVGRQVEQPVAQRQHARQQARPPGRTRGGVERLAHAGNLRGGRHHHVCAGFGRAAAIQEKPGSSGRLLEEIRARAKTQRRHGLVGRSMASLRKLRRSGKTPGIKAKRIPGAAGQHGGRRFMEGPSCAEPLALGRAAQCVPPSSRARISRAVSSRPS
ncbi:hypothetical protein D9M72_426790 [compost metagenome]